MSVSLWHTNRLSNCPILEIPAETEWYRIAKLFGTTQIRPYASKESRFDLAGVYISDRVVCGLVETRLIAVNPPTGRYVARTRDIIAQRFLFRCRLKRSLRLANISAAVDAGFVDPLIISSHIHNDRFANLATLYLIGSQPFGRELRAALPDVDGFFWASRMGLGFNIFLLADPEDVLDTEPPIMLLDDLTAQSIFAALEAGRHLPLV